MWAPTSAWTCDCVCILPQADNVRADWVGVTHSQLGSEVWAFKKKVQLWDLINNQVFFASVVDIMSEESVFHSKLCKSYKLRSTKTFTKIGENFGENSLENECGLLPPPSLS